MGRVTMKRILTGLAACCLLCAFCSCGAKDKAEETILSSGAVSEVSLPGTMVSPGPGSEKFGSGEEKVISQISLAETWDSGVTVDAEVSLINQEKLATYTGNLRIFTAEEAASALGLSLEDAVDSQINPSSPEGLVEGEHAYYQFEDGSSFVCNTTRVFYYTETYLKIHDLLVLHGKDANNKIFLTGEALPFATIEEAQGEIQGVIEQLDLPVIDEPACYTLNYEDLYEENERQYEASEELVSGLEMEPPAKLEITEDDACYVFVYPVAVDGLPLSPYLNGVYGDGSLTSGTELVVCYDKNGIAGFDFTFVPDDITASNGETALSLEEILAREEEKYNSLILEGEYFIYEIRQEYIAQPISSQKNRFTFLPVWRFSVAHTYEVDKGDGTGSALQVEEISFDIYDAITGEEIPYDIG